MRYIGELAGRGRSWGAGQPSLQACIWDRRQWRYGLGHKRALWPECLWFIFRFHQEPGTSLQVIQRMCAFTALLLTNVQENPTVVTQTVMAAVVQNGCHHVKPYLYSPLRGMDPAQPYISPTFCCPGGVLVVVFLLHGVALEDGRNSHGCWCCEVVCLAF